MAVDTKQPPTATTASALRRVEDAPEGPQGAVVDEAEDSALAIELRLFAARCTDGVPGKTGLVQVSLTGGAPPCLPARRVRDMYIHTYNETVQPTTNESGPKWNSDVKDRRLPVLYGGRAEESRVLRRFGGVCYGSRC